MGVLDGIKVVELAEHGFVPSCAAILGDWGADVVKVERPTGDPLRAIMGAGFVADTGDVNFLWELYNRNKRGIALDLRVPEGRTAFDRLVVGADVFITNFLPTARAKLRTNPEDLWAVNPRLVYAKGHGQGQQGPDADEGGFDSVSYWSRGGVGHMLTPAEGPMIMQRGAMGDAPSGAMLAGGIAAALFQRERTGKGSVVDVSLLNFAGVAARGRPDRDDDPAHRAPEDGLGHRPLEPAGRRVPDRRRSLADARHDRRPASLGARVPGVRLPGADRRPPVRRHRGAPRPTPSRCRCSSPTRSRRAPSPSCQARLGAEDTISSVLASPLEVIDDPQVVANGYLAPHPTHPTARLACAPMQFDDEQVVIRRGAPAIGEHTEEVLTETGFSAEEIAALRSAGALGEV